MPKRPAMSERTRGARCPNCRGKQTAVIDSRPHATGIRRRRKCLRETCQHRWTTVEVNVNQSRAALNKELAIEYRQQITAAIKQDLLLAINSVLRAYEG